MAGLGTRFGLRRGQGPGVSRRGQYAGEYLTQLPLKRGEVHRRNRLARVQHQVYRWSGSGGGLQSGGRQQNPKLQPHCLAHPALDAVPVDSLTHHPAYCQPDTRAGNRGQLLGSAHAKKVAQRAGLILAADLVDLLIVGVAAQAMVRQRLFTRDRAAEKSVHAENRCRLTWSLRSQDSPAERPG